jgi:nicotinamide-nucleotide amidase
MDLELVTIGTELLLGQLLDGNGAEIARQLAELGLRVARRTTVADREPDIRAAIAEALRRSGVVITTGGLGPTRDDLTKQAVAGLYDAPLEFDPVIWQTLEERFARLGRTVPATNRSQAEVPRGALVLPNRWGTAPGLWLEGSLGLTILLPGVPREMRELMRHEVIPRLAPRAGNTIIRSRTLRTTGVPESRLAELIGPDEDPLLPLTLAYLPGNFGVDLRLTAWDLPASEAGPRLEQGEQWLRARVGEWAYGTDQADLAAVLLDQARARGWHLAVAESCTGGLLGGRLTAIPGSSQVFLGGVIAYDDAIKVRELGVPAELLAAEGAVSEAAARAMVEGLTRRFGAELGISVTGIAGPGGGTASKPVGTVWLARRVGEKTEAHRVLLPGDREEIRARAAQAGLNFLSRALQAV